MSERTTRTVLLAVFVLLAAGLAAAGFAYDLDLRRRLHERAHGELRAIAKLQVESVGQWVEERRADAAGIAAQASFGRLLIEGSPATADEVGAYLADTNARHRYHGAAVVDRGGRVVLARGGDAGLRDEVLAAAARAMAAGAAVSSDLRSGRDGAACLFSAAPIRGPGGAVLGALVFGADPASTLLPVLARWPTASRTAEVLLVQRAGRTARVLSPREAGPPQVELGPGDVESLAVEAARDGRDLLEGVDRRRARVIGVARPVPGTSWIVVAKVDAAEALDEGPAQGVIALVVAALLAAAGGAVAWVSERTRRLALRDRYAEGQARRQAEERARRAAEERQRERLAAAEALRTSEERLQHVVEAADAAVWDLDVRTGAMFFGAGWARLLGRAPEGAATVADAWALVHPADQPAARAAYDAHVAGFGPAFESTHRMRAATGEWRWMHARGKVVARDDRGRALRMVGTTVDVTDRQREREQLQLAERMASLGTLAAGVAHEINNPLTYVVANVGFAAESVSELAALAGARGAGVAGDVRDALAEARAGALRVRDIVRDLKTFSRADDEREGPVDLRAVLESCLNMARNEIRHRARLAVDLAETPPVTGNEGRLGQVFLNLLLNAAQAIPEGQAERHEVRVSLRRLDGARVAVEVQDTGCGIDHEVLPRIFDPFFTTKPVGQGTGLGLSICHRIVTAMGGEVVVESEPGRGTTFRVVLPSSAPPVAPAVDASVAAARPRRRVLVVDDEPVLVSSIRRLLARHHDVTAFGDPRAALAHVALDAGYDVLLCDVLMPGMTGLELHARLREVAPRLAAATIFMTGGAFTPQAAAELDASRLPRIDKPFSPEQLLELIAQRAP
jgi:PAS domain S-box-containing protein